MLLMPLLQLQGINTLFWHLFEVVMNLCMYMFPHTHLDMYMNTVGLKKKAGEVA